ncbi:MAG TPA: YfiR family protein [Candidatus Acidoferrales bacterium]
MTTSSGSNSPQFSCRASVARRRRILFVALFLGSFAFPLLGNAQQPKLEYQVKAVYLYNFGKFVDWPTANPTASKDDLFQICVLGRDPFGPYLDSILAGETIQNRKLAARRIANSREAANCRILFISNSEAPRIKEILNSVEKSGVLTVSDTPGFTADGGMIQFVLTDNKVRFEVNLAAAERSGLTLSSQLLKVATQVKR